MDTKRIKPQYKNNKRGFSLIEIMVAITISGIVIASIFSTFTNQYKSHLVQEQVSQTQQNLRIAKETIIKDLRMAGSRVSKDIGIIPYNSTSGSDIINIVYGDPSFPSLIVQNYTGTDLYVNGDQTNYISTGDVLMLSLGDCSVLITIAGVIFVNNQTIITFVPINQSTTKTPPYFPDGFADSVIVINAIGCMSNWAGATVAKPKFMSYSIDTLTNTLQQKIYTTSGTLQVSPLADDITDMQIVYVLDTTNDPTRYDVIGDAGIFIPGVTEDQNLIREARFHLLARSSKKDNDWFVGVRPPQLGDYDYSGGSPDPDDENYRWRLLVADGFIRNLNFN